MDLVILFWVFWGWGMSLRKQCIFLSKDVYSLVISFSTTILSSKFIRRPPVFSRLKAKESEVELLRTYWPTTTKDILRVLGFPCHCINLYHSHRFGGSSQEKSEAGLNLLRIFIQNQGPFPLYPALSKMLTMLSLSASWTWKYLLQNLARISWVWMMSQVPKIAHWKNGPVWRKKWI